MASASPFASSKETTNYARLCRLLIDVGTQVLRETFDRVRPPGALDRVLGCPSVHCTLMSLRKKVLNPTQWGKLYPAIPSSVSSRNFDLTLIMVLLKNICNLDPPVTGWNSLPPATDISTEADIVRVKFFRNTVYGHATDASVDDLTFNLYWKDIKDTLVRLGGVHYEGAIDALKWECMDPDCEEHFQQLLRQWMKDDASVKDKLDVIAEELSSLKDSIIANLNPKRGSEMEDKQRTLLSLGNGQSTADRSIASVLIPPTQGNSGNTVDRTTVDRATVGSTTVNTLMDANVNPLASGFTSALFAGAHIGTISVGSFNVFIGNEKLVQNDRNGQITETDKDD